MSAAESDLLFSPQTSGFATILRRASPVAKRFLKYGASEATFSSKTRGDLPVDAHELIALCAPRPTFISYGVPAKGDAKWLDHQGSYMAAVAAGKVFDFSARKTSAYRTITRRSACPQ